MTDEEKLVVAFRTWFAEEHGSMVLKAIDAAGFELVRKESRRDIDREPVLTSTKPTFPEGAKT